jgi:transposase
MTPDEEKIFLAPFFEQAKAGGILVATPIKAAYERAIGRSVPHSTVYRLLARHGWRKIAPGKRHPKRNPDAQEEWKKNSPEC